MDKDKAILENLGNQIVLVSELVQEVESVEEEEQ
jgi:hypothetical protein